VAINPGATLTPHFRDFLPRWVGRQDWYEGAAPVRLTMVGAYRLEDRDGEVGLETHLVGDGSAVYQVPMSYRGAPLPGGPEPIATAEHSVLGRRWIYDATADPVWTRELLALVAAGATADPAGRAGPGPTTARGHLLRPWPATTTPRIELTRRLRPGPPPHDPGVLGVLLGTWHPLGPDEPPADGPLAILR
jgi:hypothetical protein